MSTKQLDDQQQQCKAVQSLLDLAHPALTSFAPARLRAHPPAPRRPMLDLNYGSSDEGPEAEEKQASPLRPAKRRRLPPLGGSFADDASTEEPSKYQGRTLARAKVVGDYPTHLYLAFDIPACFRELVNEARTLIPELHSLLDPSPPSSPLPSSTTPARPAHKLHVSLSRPLYVRKEQRGQLEVAIRDVISRTERFDTSFNALRVLRNDEQTRVFLGVDVAAGYPEITALVDRLNVVLNRFHYPPYYENPLFHTSVAWALLRRPSSSPPSPCAESVAAEAKGDFPAIYDLPRDVLDKLERHCASIRKAGGFAVDEVWMKYGAEELCFALKT